MSFTLNGVNPYFLAITLVAYLVTGSCLPQLSRVTEHNRRFLLFYTLTGLSTVGIFLSADLFTLFCFLEVMTLTSFAYVGNDETPASRRAAMSYLMYGILGGLVMLFGLLLIYSTFGTLNLDQLKYMTSHLEELDLATGKTSARAILYAGGGCLLFGFGAKAGMFPLHTWLPKTYTEAPCAGTTILSAVLSKAGIFGIYLITFHLFEKDATWSLIVTVLGCLTMLVGGFSGLFSIHLKRTLACSSMSQIGFILAAIGTGNQTGALLHTINHSLFKLILFTIVSLLFGMTKELDYNRLAGYANHKWWLKIPFLCGALGISGVPLFSGFISKSLIHHSLELAAEHSYAYHDLYQAAEWIFLISGGMTFAYMLKMYFAIFCNHPQTESCKESFVVAKPGKLSIVLLFLLSGVCLGIGLYPAFLPALFVWENLKGIFISLGIGLLIYVLFIRTCMTEKTRAGDAVFTRYRDIYPAWLDIEALIYAPVFTKFLPFVGAFFSRLFDRLVDGFSILMMKTVLRPGGRSHMKNDHPFAYAAGRLADGIFYVVHVKIRKKAPVSRTSYADLFTVGSTEFSRTTRLIIYSVSFGLLMFALGLTATLIYLLMTLN